MIVNHDKSVLIIIELDASDLVTMSKGDNICKTLRLSDLPGQSRYDEMEFCFQVRIEQ